MLLRICNTYVLQRYCIVHVRSIHHRFSVEHQIIHAVWSKPHDTLERAPEHMLRVVQVVQVCKCVTGFKSSTNPPSPATYL